MVDTSLTLSTKNGGTVSVSISDALDLILKSPMVTQLFARALVRVVGDTIAGAVTEIVVVVGKAAKQIEYERHRQRVTIRIEKLSTTTDLCARAVHEAEDNPHYPEDMKKELIEKLYRVFYSEMQQLAS